MRKRYDKLIRDRIPELMDEAGVLYEVEVADEAAYVAALRAKLVEEAREAAEADDPDDLAKEVADLYEVASALLAATGVEAATVEALRLRRHEERGGFERRRILRWTDG